MTRTAKQELRRQLTVQLVELLNSSTAYECMAIEPELEQQLGMDKESIFYCAEELLTSWSDLIERDVDASGIRFPDAVKELEERRGPLSEYAVESRIELQGVDDLRWQVLALASFVVRECGWDAFFDRTVPSSAGGLEAIKRVALFACRDEALAGKLQEIEVRYTQTPVEASKEFDLELELPSAADLDTKEACDVEEECKCVRCRLKAFMEQKMAVLQQEVNEWIRNEAG